MVNYDVLEDVYENEDRCLGYKYSIEYYDGLAPGLATLEFKPVEIMPFMTNIFPKLKPREIGAEIGCFYPMGLGHGGPLRMHFGKGIGDKLIDIMTEHAKPHSTTLYAAPASYYMENLLRRHGFIKDDLSGNSYAKLI